MGKLQPKRKPNHKHPNKILATKPNRIHHTPRNNPIKRKKTQQKLLEHNRPQTIKALNKQIREQNVVDIVD